jgi:hypothetical protein
MSMKTERQVNNPMFKEDLAKPSPMQQSAQPILPVSEVSMAEPLVGTTGHRSPYDYAVPASKMASSVKK